MEKSSFIPRSYSKSELAILYSPNITPKAAVRKLNRWIAFKPGLLEQLAATGMLPNAKVLHSDSGARHRRSIGRTIAPEKPGV